jgi:plasmid maintenance system antidote protein VapI
MPAPIAPHPGAVLKSLFLDRHGITVDEFAINLGIEADELVAFIEGRITASPYLVDALSRQCGTSVNYWHRLQRVHSETGGT